MTENTELNTFINSLTLDEYHKTFLFYALSGGKLYRKRIFDRLDKTRRYRNLGWAIELLHAYLLITDDIIDNSDIRRDKPAWHKKHPKNVLKDARFLYALIFQVLLSYKDHKNYFDIVKTFQFVATKTWVGQCQDGIRKDVITNEDICRYYNSDYYTEQLIAKTSYYTLILPIRVGCLVHFMEYKEYYDDLCNAISFLIQYQDDYLNYYPAQSGKSGTDLQEKKVTWFLCEVMRDKNNIDVMYQYLVNNDFDTIMEKIQPLLDNYKSHEKTLNDSICKRIQDDDDTFKFIMELIYQRRK